MFNNCYEIIFCQQNAGKIKQRRRKLILTWTNWLCKFLCTLKLSTIFPCTSTVCLSLVSRPKVSPANSRHSGHSRFRRTSPTIFLGKRKRSFTSLLVVRRISFSLAEIIRGVSRTRKWKPSRRSFLEVDASRTRDALMKINSRIEQITLRFGKVTRKNHSSIYFLFRLYYYDPACVISILKFFFSEPWNDWKYKISAKVQFQFLLLLSRPSLRGGPISLTLLLRRYENVTYNTHVSILNNALPSPPASSLLYNAPLVNSSIDENEQS